MDNKQKRIFNNILEKNDLDKPKTFIQNRNLKEFRCFFIERINPNHHILLYGKLKNPKDNNYSKAIKVGEILLSMGCFIMIPSFIMAIAVNVIAGVVLLDILLSVDIYANRNRGECRNGQNALSCAMS